MSPTHAISKALAGAGITKRYEQAGICGEVPSAWTRYLNDKASPKCSKVQGWLKAAKAEGYDLTIIWEAGQCRAVLVEPEVA